jgi:hypothetical protein
MMISGIVYSLGDWIAQVCKILETNVEISYFCCVLIVLLCFCFIFSAMKVNPSSSTTAQECLDRALLALHYMVPFHITITSFVR